MLYNCLSLRHISVLPIEERTLRTTLCAPDTNAVYLCTRSLYSPLLKNTRSGTFPFVFCTMSSYSSGSYDLIVDDLMELQWEEHGLSIDSNKTFNELLKSVFCTSKYILNPIHSSHSKSSSPFIPLLENVFDLGSFHSLLLFAHKSRVILCGSWLHCLSH